MVREIKYFFRKFSFLKVMNSPLKPLKLQVDWGEIRHGTPYFLPRKWVKCKDKTGYNTAKPVKWLWVDVISLGWKSKWDDLRFEWAPAISIVILKRQLFILFTPKLNTERIDTYWEAWLYYDQRTDKSKSKEDRLIELFNIWSCTWIHYKNGKRVPIDYFPSILRDKYLVLYQNWLTTQKKEDA